MLDLVRHGCSTVYYLLLREDRSGRIDDNKSQANLELSIL